ncbi:hypothetical protein J6590_006502 [Homalodisca vitripennis]|nr:hypothetical protein J6590_006502 [Homalodisca vitripennis]
MQQGQFTNGIPMQNIERLSIPNYIDTTVQNLSASDPRIFICCLVSLPDIHIDTLERVQIRFLRLIGLPLGYQFLETPVDCLRISLGLPHLATRRRMADILILHKMVNGALDCPRLLSLLEFRIPTSTRSGDIFFKRALPSLYSYHSCIPRLMREGNEVSGGVEFFGSSYQSFRSAASHADGHIVQQPLPGNEIFHSDNAEPLETRLCGPCSTLAYCRRGDAVSESYCCVMKHFNTFLGYEDSINDRCSSLHSIILPNIIFFHLGGKSNFPASTVRGCNNPSFNYRYSSLQRITLESAKHYYLPLTRGKSNFPALSVRGGNNPSFNDRYSSLQRITLESAKHYYILPLTRGKSNFPASTVRGGNNPSFNDRYSSLQRITLESAKHYILPLTRGKSNFPASTIRGGNNPSFNYRYSSLQRITLESAKHYYLPLTRGKSNFPASTVRGGNNPSFNDRYSSLQRITLESAKHYYILPLTRGKSNFPASTVRGGNNPSFIDVKMSKNLHTEGIDFAEFNIKLYDWLSF